MTKAAWSGQVALITGASSGIGRATAEAFAAEGAAVVCVGRRAELLDEVVRGIAGLGGAAAAVCADLRTPSTAALCVEKTIARFGRLDVLVHNAGVGLKRAIDDTGDEDVQRLVETNLLAPVRLTREALPHLRRTRGRIVLVSSVAGRRGFPQASVYCATKFALAGLAESWRVELAASGVRVILVCPGRTDTDFFVNAGFPAEHGPGGRATMARPEAVAQRILRDAARGTREDIVSRGGRLIVWLNAIAPSLCDRLVARLPP